MAENETPDVLPAWANETLILLWLVLLGGRWLLAPALQLAGLLSAPQLAALDDSLLLKLYLVLLAITCIVVALRAVRLSQSGAQPLQPAGDGATMNAETLNAEPLNVDTLNVDTFNIDTLNIDTLNAETLNVESPTVDAAVETVLEASNQGPGFNEDNDILQANGPPNTAPIGGDENP